jgi:hypothetical protein
MSLDLERRWLPRHHVWMDVNRITCDLCGAQSGWGEACDIGAGWDHMLGLDCCPACSRQFYEAGGVASQE